MEQHGPHIAHSLRNTYVNLHGLIISEPSYSLNKKNFMLAWGTFENNISSDSEVYSGIHYF